MRNLFLIITLMIIFSVIIIDVYALDWQETYYSPGKWTTPLPYQGFVPDAYIKQGYWACSGGGCGEPFRGYPYHSGLVEGVNDTVLIWVELKNFTSSPKTISSLMPESWFVPIIYKTYTDLAFNRIWVDTSVVDYTFKYWFTHGLITKPMNIPSRGEVSLVYYLWNLPGYNGVIDVNILSSAPSDLSLKKIGPGQYWKTIPESKKDTINAFIEITNRMIHWSKFSIAKSWTDSILAKEDSSLAGWEIRGDICLDLQDTLGAIDCFGRAASIYINNHDPLLDWQDTLRTTDDEKRWASDRYNYSSYMFWKLSTGNNDLEE